MKHISVIITFCLLMSYGVPLDVSQAQPAAPAPPTTGAQSGASTQTASQAPVCAPGCAPGSNMEKAGGVLFVFLVLSVVFEVALTPIFNWSLFLRKFEGRGVKTPVTVILAFLVFWGYGLDIVKDLLEALCYTTRKTLGGQFLTSLLIAGGSDGVLRIFTKLGIRNNPEERKLRAEQLRAAAK